MTDNAQARRLADEASHALEPIYELLAGIAADVLRSKHCTAYPACGPDVRAAGGHYEEIAVDSAMTDGNLVSAPAWPAHPQWIAQFLALLGTTIHHA